MLLPFVDRIARRVSPPGDESEVRAQKTLLVLSALLFIPPGLVWSAIYFIYDERLSAAIPFAYVIVSLLGLATFLITGWFALLRWIELALILALPFALQLTLGGFVPSSGVVLWSLLAPIGALVFGARRAALWLLAFLALVATAGVLEGSLRGTNALPDWLRTAFFVLNIAAISTLAVTLLAVFNRQRDQAMHLLAAEQERSEGLVLNILPKQIADRLKAGERRIADSHGHATVLFADLVGSTALALELAPDALIGVLNDVFSYIDDLAERHGVEKIRTIGDNWMGVSGVPRSRPDHAQSAVRMALDVRDFVERYRTPDGRSLAVRIGLNSGSLVAGVIGKHKFVYDIWSDTVNTASRMESQGMAGRVQVSEATYALVKDDFVCEERGAIDVRGRGRLTTYFVLAGR
ncbi:MAG TPA: adenylate/guanylate cyclase domain-containing protein [Candidatus Limnocylindria bacterium]